MEEEQINIVTCVRCKRDRKHYAKNLCKSCYKHINLNKEKHKESIRRWKQKNPNYFKEYYRRKNEKK